MSGEKEKLIKVEGTTFTVLEFTGQSITCPHCGKPIKFRFKVATIEFEKEGEASG